jgi:transcriptional regulator with XRE-family HTH domain
MTNNSSIKRYKKTPIDQAFTKLVGNNIMHCRKTLHLTQTDVAEKLNITFQQYQKYEKGESEMSVVKLNKICLFFKERGLAITPNHLLGYTSINIHFSPNGIASIKE